MHYVNIYELPEWKNRADLIRLIIPFNPDALYQIDPVIFEDIERVNIGLPTWKTDLKIIKYVLPFNPALFNELDPSRSRTV